MILIGLHFKHGKLFIFSSHSYPSQSIVRILTSMVGKYIFSYHSLQSISLSREERNRAQQSAMEEVVLDQLRPSTAPLESTPHNVKSTKSISLMQREAMTENYSRDANLNEIIVHLKCCSSQCIFEEDLLQSPHFCCFVHSWQSRHCSKCSLMFPQCFNIRNMQYAYLLGYLQLWG